MNIPKLVVIIASPVVRQCFQQKPPATTAKFVHTDIKLSAMRSIAQWLENVTNGYKFPELAMPADIQEALDLRLTAYTLGMERYFKHLDGEYLQDLKFRIPSISELVTAVNYTREDDDAVVAGLANRVAHLRRFR